MLNTVDIILICVSGIAFIFYGLSVLLTDHMINEFTRYKMLEYRMLTGYLELLGGLGLIASFYIPKIGILSSLGLGTLMLMGSMVRIRIKDPLLDTLPAILLMLVNYYLFYRFI